MFNLVHIPEGIRMFCRSIRVRIYGIKPYHGTPAQISKKILNDCYKKTHFHVSSGHFQTFYCRDFGWIVDSLLALGYEKQVHATLRYALDRFRKQGRIRVAINKWGIPFDFPTYAVDSVPYLLYALAATKKPQIIKGHRLFLESEIMHHYHTVVDKKTGLVKKDKYFSSMKDHSKRSASCYDACMLYMMQQACEKLGLVNPLRKYKYSKIITDTYWTGKYFKDDLSGATYLAGDAQVFPFWTGAITDKQMLKNVIREVQRQGLDSPLPLRYTQKGVTTKTIMHKIFAPDYESYVVWTHMGLLWVAVVGKVDKRLQKTYTASYTALIKKMQTFPEVLWPDKKPYSSLWYYCDEGMSWCANYLALVSKETKPLKSRKQR